MAYRKTEKVLAQIEAKRNAIIAAALDVVAKSGKEGLSTDAAAIRAEVSVGTIYQYFPDKIELFAGAVQHVMERDLKALRLAVEEYTNPTDRLIAAIKYLFSTLSSNYALMKVIGNEPAYKEPMRAELARLIRAIDPSESPSILAAVAYGAVFEMGGSSSRVADKTLCTVVLRGCGVASKELARVL